MSLRRLAAAAFLFLAAPVFAADESPRSYAALAPLTLAPGEGLQGLTLPWPVLQASRSAGLADLRIFDGQGQTVPIAWAGAPQVADQQRRLSVPRFAWPEAAMTSSPAPAVLQLQLNRETGAVLSLLPAAGKPAAAPAGEVRVWLLDLSALGKDEIERLDRIALDWPRREAGLSTSVEAEASSDGRQWQAVTQAQLLELPGGDTDAALSLKHLAWPAHAVRPRYLRLSFGMPLRLTVSDVQMSRAGTAAPLLEQPVVFEPAGGGEGWLLDLRGPIAPRALALRLPEVNSLLQLRLEQRNGEGEPWRLVQRFSAWRLQRGGRESQSEALQLAPGQTAPARYWRLLAEGGGGKPTGALAASLFWQPPRLILLARGESRSGFQLAVGRERAPAVAQPLASLMPAYRSGDELSLPSASIGPLSVQEAPGAWERLREANGEDQRRWLLWLVLVAAVAGLGALAWRMLKQIAPPPP